MSIMFDQQMKLETVKEGEKPLQEGDILSAALSKR
jgi:hypothetical protein